MLGPSSSSQLEALIARACDPYRPSPDLALNLEISDYVNNKKANTPRDAAFCTLKFINHRNEHVNVLALSLLDILVKNCGYPLHLQIATKEFLNELVRRFPERPPVYYKPPMQRILQLIHEWKMTICMTSKYKDDLVHIRDMHRLLTYKGYRFPEFDRRSAHILTPADDLKTPEEREEEDRAAQGAKLQELIRRGKPKDLAAAQQLMKVMAGADTSSRPDYAKQTQKELNGIQQRILLLNEMLSNSKEDEKFVEGDAYDQLAQRSRQIQPKLQQWISQSEENDPDLTDKLLLMNDLINQVLARYKAFKKGDRTVTAEVNPALTAKDPKSIEKAAAVAKQANLIDFDDPEPAQTIIANSNKETNDETQQQEKDQRETNNAESLIDGLSGISFGNNTSQPQQSGSGSGTSNNNNNGNNTLPANLFDPIPSQGAIQLGTTPMPPSTSSQNINALIGGLGGSSTSSQPSSPSPSLFTQQQQLQQPPPINQVSTGVSSSQSSSSGLNAADNTTQQQQQKKKDPFDDLADLF